VAPSPENGHQIPPDADTQGFVGYPGARGNDINPAMTGRMADSAVVICETGAAAAWLRERLSTDAT